MKSRLSAILSVFFFAFVGLGLMLSAPQANSGSGDIGNGLTHRHTSAPSSNIQLLAVAQFAEQRFLPTTSVRTTFSQTIYLPLVSRPSGRLYGTVSENGVPRRDFTVTLEFCPAYDNVGFGRVACIGTQYLDTTTDQAGGYSFNALPSLILTGPLLMSQTYQVVWYNTDDNPNRLRGWRTRLLDSYTSGDIIDIGDFDVSGFKLVSPESYVVVNWPITFRWTRRATMPSDSYQPCIASYGSWMAYPIWCDEPLGYVDSFVLDRPLNREVDCTNASPEPGFSGRCDWSVAVHAPDGGVGYSRDTFGLLITP